MVKTVLLDRDEIAEVMAFYLTHARDGILCPRDPKWIKDRLGTDFFLIGIRIKEELVAVAWAAILKDFVYFTVENEALVVHNDGHYPYSGGWCIRPDRRSKGLFHLLTATVNLFWFTRINKGENVTLWGRMVGQKDIDGNPLFWNRVGERITGLSYRDLIAFPFGTMEEEIFTRWPKEPIPFKNIPQNVIEQTLGKTYEPLVGPLQQFLKWGWVVLSDRYVPTSLNRFFWSASGNISDPQGFYHQALLRVINEFESA